MKDTGHLPGSRRAGVTGNPGGPGNGAVAAHLSRGNRPDGGNNGEGLFVHPNSLRITPGLAKDWLRLFTVSPTI